LSFRFDKFGKIAIAATSETSVGSSSKVNSPVSIKPTKGSTVEELDEIMENLDLEESLGYSDMGSDENLDKSSNYSKENFMSCYGNVSGNSEDIWRTRLKLHNDENIIPPSASSHYASNQHQVYVIINDTSKEFDAQNNPIINPQNPARGANHRAEGETESAVATREKVCLSAAEWQMIKAAVNHGAIIPANSTREVVMGY
jgi:hypothetical protein